MIFSRSSMDDLDGLCCDGEQKSPDKRQVSRRTLSTLDSIDI